MTVSLRVSRMVASAPAVRLKYSSPSRIVAIAPTLDPRPKSRLYRSTDASAGCGSETRVEPSTPGMIRLVSSSDATKAAMVFAPCFPVSLAPQLGSRMLRV